MKSANRETDVCIGADIRFFIIKKERCECDVDYKQKVKECYASGGEVNRAGQMGEYGMEFINTKKILDSYIFPDKKVIELGCGGGYYGMHYGPRCQEYLGIDLSPVNVEIFSKEIEKAGYKNVRAEVGDATALTRIPDESQDVVLCLGPMYHLNHDDRIICMQECRRICRTDGILVFAFINKIGAMTKFGNGTGWENVLTPAIEDCVMNRGTDDVNTDIFYYTMPEEILQGAKEAGLSKIKMAGVDFLLLEHEIEEFTEEQKRIWFHFSELVTESEYATSLCNHALLVCRKEAEKR